MTYADIMHEIATWLVWLFYSACAIGGILEAIRLMRRAQGHGS